MAYIVIQQGGSTYELYVHAFDELEEAETYRVDAGGATYDTSEPIPVDDELINNPELLKLLATVVRAAAEMVGGL